MGAILAQGRATPPLPSGAGVLHRRIKHEADLLEIIRSIHHRAAGVAGLCDGVGGGMRVLVACEFTGTVRNSFLRKGHDAWSCDLLPAEDRHPNHIKGDCRPHLKSGEWDLIIAHPVCTRLTNAGARWLQKPPKGRTQVQMWRELFEGAELFSDCLNANCERVCVENPVMHKHAKEAIEGYFEFTQSLQPWQFGHPETKRICLWLQGLDPLKPTNIVDGREPKVHHMSPGPDRARERSRFFSGVSDAMADLWGCP